MGKESHKIKKTVKNVSGLEYVEVKHVPMTVDPEFGNLIDSAIIERMERLIAQELILRRLPLRGREVKFLRSIFALSQREFAEKLDLSHVAIFKWEKRLNGSLDRVNEIAVKVLVADLLGLKVTASLDSLVGQGVFPKKLILDFSEAPTIRRSA